MAQASPIAIPSTGSGKRRRGGRNADQRLFVAVTLIPTTAGLILFWIYPLASGLWGSFTDWKAFQNHQSFIGIDNYRTLWHDKIFIKSLKNTALYTLMYLPLDIVIGLLLAMAVEGSGRLKGLFRTVYFMPVVASTIATALMWKWLYQPSLGLFNQIFDMVGLPMQTFLNTPSQALPSIVAYSLWKNVGLTMVLFMAGLNGIDRSYYEAAKVDGASRGRLFRDITLPLLRATMVFVTITGFIETIQVFDPIYILSSVGANSPPGGPSNSTVSVAIYQWSSAFDQLNLGYGMAIGMVLFVIILAVTLTQARFLRQSWEY